MSVCRIFLTIGAVCLAYGVTKVRGAELEAMPPSPRTHQLVVCKPDEECVARGKPRGATACLLDAASDRMNRDLPKGTRVECRRVGR